jgi:hypothetical protein
MNFNMDLHPTLVSPSHDGKTATDPQWTLVLTDDAAYSYLSCVSEHSSHSEDCWIELTQTTITLPPSTVTSDHFISITAALLSAIVPTSTSTSFSTSSPAMPVSTAAAPVPTDTSAPSTKPKTSPAFRIQIPRPLLFLALLSLLATATWPMA